MPLSGAASGVFPIRHQRPQSRVAQFEEFQQPQCPDRRQQGAQVFFSLPPLRRRFYMLRQRDKFLSPGFERFWEHCRAGLGAG